MAGGDHCPIDINPVIDRLGIGWRLVDKFQHGTISAANIGNRNRLFWCYLMHKRQESVKTRNLACLRTPENALGGVAAIGKPVAIGSVELAFMVGIDETANQS